MAARSDWHRCKDWTLAERERFDAKIARSRQPWSKWQYFRGQALLLFWHGRSADAKAEAVRLLERSLVEVAGACGSALMKEPELAQEIVKAVRAALPADIPVTVKHRAGWDEKHLNAPEFACAMVEAGAAMITVHGRTRTQGFSGKSSLDIIRKVREAVPMHVPVVGNGDVVSLLDYVRMRTETGCDAVMIGRGALGNPWLFRDIRAWLRGEPAPGAPTVEERSEVFLRHCELMRGRTEEKRLIHEIRKAVAWYTKGLPGSADLRDQSKAPRDPDALIAVTVAYFAELAKGRPRLRVALSALDESTAATESDPAAAKAACA